MTGSCSPLTVRTEGKSDGWSVGGLGKVEKKVLLTAVTEAPVSINIKVSQSCIEPVIERLSEGNLTLESNALTCELWCSLFSPEVFDSAKVVVHETSISSEPKERSVDRKSAGSWSPN